MSRLAKFAVLLALALWVGAAGAQPSAAQVQQAAEAFDQGSRAFQAGHFELAASQFEAADAAVPSARAVRMAMRARSNAGQEARAATLAAYAKQRYSDDEATVSLADEILEPLEPKLFRLTVSCASACLLAIGTRVVPGKPATERVLYVRPGAVSVSASFVKEKSSVKKEINAGAAGSKAIHLQPAPVEPPETPPPAPSTSASSTAPSAPPSSSAPPDSSPPEPPESSGWHPAVFITFLVATAGASAVTIWSGVDTINNPGKDAVRDQCAGLGTDCELYQDGLAKQTRTNVLIGVSAGLGALTIISAILTDWGGSPDTSSEARIRMVPAPGGLGVSWRF